MSLPAVPARDVVFPPEFDDLVLSRVGVGDVSLRVRAGGCGPPLLLFARPSRDAPGLGAGRRWAGPGRHVVAPDLRGYGESSKPAAAPTHESYGKRVMAEDRIGLMRQVGFDRFDVVGHGRAGRRADRMALDPPRAVRRLTVMHVIPTAEAWARADARFALGYWHWGLLAQPHPIPERLIERDPEFSFDAEFGGAIRGFPPTAVDDHARCARDPAATEAMCEDYRAGRDRAP